MRAIVRFLHDARDLLVDATRRLLGVILRVAVVATEEHLVVGLAEHLGAQRTHAVLRDDGARHLRSALEVVRRARGDVLAEDLLSHTAAHEHRQLGFHLGKRVQDLVLVGNGKRVAERAPREMIEILCTGSACSSRCPTRA